RLDLRDIDVRADFESQLDGHVTVVRARRIEVEEMIDPGELQLDGTGDRFRHDLRAGTGIIGFDLHHRRSDFRKLSDGQGQHRHQPYHHHDDGKNRGKYRSIDEKAEVHLDNSAPPTSGDGGVSGGVEEAMTGLT